MYSISRIQQVLKAVPQGAFEQIVQRHDGDRYVKRFRCRDQLIAMLYVQLAGAQSLRELEAGFNGQRCHHYHLGTGAVARSTLSQANEKRNPLIYAELLKLLIEQAGRAMRRERSELLYLLDATTVPLPPRCSQQLRGHSSKRGNHGMKLHVQFEAGSGTVQSASITKARVNDITEGRKVDIECGATYVFDKGYCNYNWWHSIDQKGARFVTRFKRDAALRLERELPADAANAILSDRLVAFALRAPRGGHRNSYSTPLRRIEVQRADQAPLVLATNDLESPAAEIAQLYKERWGIELLFKWVKQHLQIRRFVGRNENAIRIQLFTALIAYMLVVLLKKTTHFQGSAWMLLAELRHGLFQRPRTDESYFKRRRKLRAHIAAVQPSLFT
jgi:putative transposase